jgi:hypothetical protein
MQFSSTPLLLLATSFPELKGPNDPQPPQLEHYDAFRTQIGKSQFVLCISILNEIDYSADTKVSDFQSRRGASFLVLGRRGRAAAASALIWAHIGCAV